MRYDFMIVGAGYAGSVTAQRLASAGKRVLVIDRRDHIAGNAYDYVDAHGIRVHRYGPHIFHTNSKTVFDYLSQFTAWHPYEHRVLAHVEGELYPVPINRVTINRLYNLDLDEAGVKAFYEKVRTKRDRILTSEDVVLSTVGEDLYKKFFRGYTRKHWGLDPSQLSSSVLARIPVRTNDDDRYFSDTYQQMPADGYTAMFERMLEHENITVRLETTFAEAQRTDRGAHVIYTGPIDSYFDHQFGRLPYRSVEFETFHLEQERFQPVAQVNYPNDHEYTRITEYKHMTGQQHPGTSYHKEYARAEGDPYYPIPRPENAALYAKYAKLTEQLPNVSFVGRLARYRYYNMDQVIASALKVADRLLGTDGEPEAQSGVEAGAS